MVPGGFGLPRDFLRPLPAIISAAGSGTAPDPEPDPRPTTGGDVGYTFTITNSDIRWTGGDYAYPYHCFHHDRDADRNGKRPPLWLKLFESIQKFIERKDRFKAFYIVSYFDKGKRGFCPYYPWTLMRRFDMMII